MPWNLSSDRPIYMQLMEHIEKDILAGHYPPGERLPSVRELASDASVNPNTMQKALQELERNGLLISNRTSGRTITEDQELLAQARKELAKQSLNIFIKEMNALGYSNEDILAYIKDEF